jgi:hypothetical protein
MVDASWLAISRGVWLPKSDGVSAAVPKTVKTRKKLKNTKKKFLDMTDNSISPCDIVPWRVESPGAHQRLPNL